MKGSHDPHGTNSDVFRKFSTWSGLTLNKNELDPISSLFESPVVVFKLIFYFYNVNLYSWLCPCCIFDLLFK